MSILLIRHGQTCENKNQIVQPAEVSLCELGLQQAGLLAHSLRSQGITRILSSDLPRALQTANQIGIQTQGEMTVSALLRERNFGSLRGRTYADIGFDFLDEHYTPPEGESSREFHLRVAEAWHVIVELAAITEGRLVVVTHGLVCRAIVNNHLYNEHDQPIPDRWDNTAVSEFTKTAPYNIIRLNDTEHLNNTVVASELSAQV